MVGAHGHADARMDVDGVSVEGHLDFQRSRDRFGNPLRVAQPAARHEDGKLVAADAGDGVGRTADDRAQPGGDLAQQHVADRMAERFVDMPEMIEIENQHGDRRARARAGCDRLLHAIREQHLRRQTRQRVTMGEFGHFRHVGRDAFLHRAKCRQQHPDFVLAHSGRNRRKVARGGTTHGGGHFAQRANDSSRQGQPDHRRCADPQQGDQPEPLLQPVERFQRRRQRPLQYPDGGIVGAWREVDDPRDHIVAELRVAIGADRGIPVGADVAREIRPRRLRQRAGAGLPLAALGSAQQRDLEPGQTAHFLRHCVVDPDASGNPHRRL